MKNKNVLFAIFFFQFFLSVCLTYGNSNPIEYAAKKLYKENFKVYNKEKSTVDSVLHPLRVLASMSACTSMDKTDHIRINEGDIVGLEDAACSLVNALPSTFRDSFKVYDYSMYPLLFFSKENQGASVAFEGLVNKIENIDQTKYYFLIGKQIDPNDYSVTFRTRLRLPGHGAFDVLNNQILVENIRTTVQDAIVNGYSDKNSLDSLISAEIIGIESLEEIVNSIVGGTFGGELTEEILEDFGFAELAGLPGNYRLGNKDINSNDIVDYAGIEVGINNNWSYFRDNIAASINYAEITDLNLNLKFLITEDQNYATGEFEQARQKYHNTNAELQYWFHISIDSTNNANTRIYLNINNRITEEKGEEVFMNLYNDYLEIRDPEPNPAKPAAKTATCPPKFSDFVSHPTTWTAKEYLLDCYGSCSGCISYSFLNDYWFGFASGGIDSIMESVNFFGMLGQGIYKALINDPPSLTNLGVAWCLDGIWRTGKKCVAESSWEVWNWEWDKNEEEVWREKFVESQEFWEGVHTMLEAIYDTKFYDIYQALKSSLKVWYNDITGSNGSKAQGYTIGKSVCEVVLGIFTGGATLSTKAVAKSGKAAFGGLMKAIRDKNLGGLLDDAWQKLPSAKQIKCKILGTGCFIEDTPVLVAPNTIPKSGKVYALASGLPFLAMPIQDVPLLSWVPANQFVNGQNDFIASVDDVVYLSLGLQDNYTSAQQKDRDEYRINEEDWYSVSFEQLDGTSKCHFALHSDWIKNQGYEAEKVVILNLPEQGINGPFRVTAIKHILPQKKPEGDAGDGYDWEPVTALFEHESNQVYTIDFDNGESLGVTYQHPIFSVTAGDWRLASELKIGEKVQTYNGESAVTESKIIDCSKKVYNLEVKDLHNFLVGDRGFLVHNSCWDEALKFASGKVNKSEIWALKKFPEIFQRGNIIEKVMRKLKYSATNGWKYTGKGDGGLGISNYWLIDFYKGNKVVSLKSTKHTNGATWASENAQHIRDLNTRKIIGNFPNCNGCSNPSHVINNVNQVELHIIIEDVSKINKSNWITEIKSKLPQGERENLIITISEM